MDLRPPLNAVQLELTNRCSLDCDECARRHMSRPLGDMEWDMALRIAEQAADAGAGIVPSGLGEPLLWQQIVPYLEVVQRRFPDMMVTLFTSLVASSEARSKFVDLMANYRGRILVAITIHYAQGPGKYTNPDEWQEIERTAHELRYMDAGPREIHVAIQPTLSPGARKRFGNIFGQNSDRVHSASQQIEAWFGLVNDRCKEELAPPSLPSEEPCSRPFEDTFMVLHDGRCVACCQDVIDPGHVVGDLNEESLMDVWHGDAMIELRKRHLNRNVEGISPCNGCARTVSYHGR